MAYLQITIRCYKILRDNDKVEETSEDREELKVFHPPILPVGLH
jgi:hypothetical protein